MLNFRRYFLRTGVAGKSAVDLAWELLIRFDSLTGLFAADQNIFCQMPGMGPVKFAQLQAVVEMARRALREELKKGDAMSSPKSMRDYFRLSSEGKKHEIFIGIFLDAQNCAIASEELFNGTLTQASVYPHEVVKRALALVDVKVLDHFIIGGGNAMSFAERGLI